MQELLVSFEVFSNRHEHLFPHPFVVVCQTNAEQLIKHFEQLIVSYILALLCVQEECGLNRSDLHFRATPLQAILQDAVLHEPSHHFSEFLPEPINRECLDCLHLVLLIHHKLLQLFQLKYIHEVLPFLVGIPQQFLCAAREDLGDSEDEFDL